MSYVLGKFFNKNRIMKFDFGGVCLTFWGSFECAFFVHFVPIWSPWTSTLGGYVSRSRPILERQLFNVVRVMDFDFRGVCLAFWASFEHVFFTLLSQFVHRGT